jgi:hypothetical protein
MTSVSHVPGSCPGKKSFDENKKGGHSAALLHEKTL